MTVHVANSQQRQFVKYKQDGLFTTGNQKRFYPGRKIFLSCQIERKKEDSEAIMSFGNNKMIEYVLT